MSLGILGGEYVFGQGNSISTDSTPAGIWWGGPTGGYIAQVQSLLTPVVPSAKKNFATSTGILAGNIGVLSDITSTVPGYKQVIQGHFGHSGANAQQILADLPNGLYKSVPVGAKLVLLLEDGINDANNILGGSETLADFVNFHHQIYVAVTTRYPTAIIIDLSCLCLGEIHTGNAWGANPADSQIVSVDNAKQSEVALWPSNAVYADFRAPLLTWEIANNPAQDPGGHAVFLEGNNVHPIATTGMLIMATAVLGAVPVVP
jgi:hypothetical protein